MQDLENPLDDLNEELMQQNAGRKRRRKTRRPRRSRRVRKSRRLRRSRRGKKH